MSTNMLYRPALKHARQTLPLQSRRAFSISRSQHAEARDIKKLGVIGAGQMVFRPLLWSLSCSLLIILFIGTRHCPSSSTEGRRASHPCRQFTGFHRQGPQVRRQVEHHTRFDEPATNIDEQTSSWLKMSPSKGSHRMMPMRLAPVLAPPLPLTPCLKST